MSLKLWNLRLNLNIETFSVVWIVLTSGTMVFNICNMLPSMFILLGAALAMLYKYRGISKKNTLICVGVLLFTLISTFVNGVNNIVVNDLAILCIRLFSLIIIMSNVDSEHFKKVYINTIFVIAAVSLPCFFLKLIVPSLTLPFTIQDPDTGFYGTFYYTLGTIQKGVFNRNCGIFWESGLFQMYLNYAVALLIVNPEKMVKNATVKFVVLSIAVITTVSTMGYICYAIVTVMALSARKSKMGKRIAAFALVALVALLAVESTTHIIEYKLINKGMSYGSRYDDTMISLVVARDNPIWGVGPVNDHVYIVESYMEIVKRLSSGSLSRSNGLGTFLVKFGFPMTLLYLCLVYKRNMQINSTTRLNTLLILIMLICCFCNEPIMFTTLWLSFFFRWKEPQKEIYSSNSESLVSQFEV